MLVAVGDIGGAEGDDLEWVAEFERALPDAEVGLLDDVDPERIEFVVCWAVDAERLASLPALRGVCVSGAGYDHVDLARMPNVPIVRLVDPGMAVEIAAYSMSWITHFTRDFDRFAAAQRTATWLGALPQRFARDVTVGVLGAGTIGSVVLEWAAAAGHPTVGWSRRRHDRPLEQFWADCEIVVSVLPLTTDTRGMIGAAELTALGEGVLINVGRGPTLDAGALLTALDGPLRAVVLDVFDVEPMPADSPLWSHPKAVVTPHIAGRTDPRSVVAIISASIRELCAGQRPVGTIN